MSSNTVAQATKQLKSVFIVIELNEEEFRNITQQSDGFLPASLPLKKLVWDCSWIPFTSNNRVHDYAPLFLLLELWSGIQA